MRELARDRRNPCTFRHVCRDVRPLSNRPPFLRQARLSHSNNRVAGVLRQPEVLITRAPRVVSISRLNTGEDPGAKGRIATDLLVVRVEEVLDARLHGHPVIHSPCRIETRHGVILGIDGGEG